MLVRGYGVIEDHDHRWRVVDSFRLLGHIMESSGSIITCYKATISALWRQFWAKMGKPVFRSFDIKLKMARIQTLVFPILNFRISRWPFGVSRARDLDRVQRKMVGISLGAKPRQDEPLVTFFRREHQMRRFEHTIRDRRSPRTALHN